MATRLSSLAMIFAVFAAMGAELSLDEERVEAVYGGRAFTRVVEGALRHPLFVGSHWFQYRDQPLVGRGDGENYQIGFVDVCDRAYPKLTAAARAVGETMYETRYNGK